MEIILKNLEPKEQFIFLQNILEKVFNINDYENMYSVIQKIMDEVNKKSINS